MEKNLAHFLLWFDIAEMHKKNMDMIFAMMLAPAAIGVSGVVFLHYGLDKTIVLSLSGLIGGMLNAILPCVE